MTAAGSAGGLLGALSEGLADAVERASRAVVAVDARRHLAASGIVWPGSGIVVTADHVLEREEDIKVTLADGRKVSATVAGRDPGTDIAVLRLADTPPETAEMAPIGSIRVGHVVLALGRPGGGGPMASFGIVSALGGPWRTGRGGVLESYVRADVTLYPGFSGGPLVDTGGRVVGLNSWHLARGEELAIPAPIVDALVHTLVTHGRLRRAYLGITSQPVRLPAVLREKLGLRQEIGLLVVGVEPGSPADEGGLLLGDVLVAVAGQVVADAEDLQAVLGPDVVGKSSTCTLVRGGELTDVSVTPGERA